MAKCIATDAEMIRELKLSAKCGCKIKVNDKSIWAGLGNRSGLHDYANELTENKWEKGQKRFAKKLEALVPGDVVEILSFYNINRDRGRWNVERKYLIVTPS